MKTKWNWIVILAMLLGLVFPGSKQIVSAETGDLTIEPFSLPDAMITVNFQLLLIARYSGGSGCTNCLWYTTLGSLPEGVHLNGDTGELLGAPTTVGNYTFTVVVDDRNGVVGSQEYTWNITKVKTLVGVGNSTTYVGNTNPTTLGAAARHPDPYYSTQPTGKMSFSVDGVPVPGCSGADALSTNSWGQAYCTSYVPPTGLAAGAYDIQAEFTPDSTSSELYLSATGTGTLQVNPPQAIVSGMVFMDDNQNLVRDEGEVSQGTWNVSLNQDCDSYLEGDVVTNELTGEFSFYPVPIDGHTYCLYVDLSGFNEYVQTTPYDNLTLSGDQYFEIGVYYPHISILPNPEELLRGSVGTYFTQTFQVSGGTPPYNIETISTLPEGLTFDLDTLTLFGTPTAGGLGQLSLSVADSVGIRTSVDYTLMIMSDGDFTFTSSPNPSAPGETVTFTVEASGNAVTPYGTLPPAGLVTFFADGNPIEGCSKLFLNVMPDENGELIFGDFPVTCITAALETSTHEITATYLDGFGVYNEPSLSLTQQVGAVSSLVISPETLPNAEYQTPYSQQLTAKGGIESYTFSLISGALPNGISLSATGLLSGFADSPAAPGIYPITIQVVDANGVTASRDYTFTLDKGVPTVTAKAASVIYWSQPFTISAEVLKKISESSYAVVDGTVAFFIDGTAVPGCEAVPEVNGDYVCPSVSMELAVGPHTLTADFTPTGWYAGYYTSGSDSSEFTVQPFLLSIPGAVFMDADQNGVWDEGESRINESGWMVNLDQGCDETVDYTFQPVTGIFNFTNIPVSGQCHRITVIGTPGYQQTIQPADFYPVPGTAVFIEVGFYYPTIIVSPIGGPGIYDLPNGTIGMEYNQVFSASGGAEPYVYTISFGSLPEGLTLSTDGTLSGTPTQNGYYNFTVRAEDANHAIGQNSYNLSIERVKVDGVFNFTSSSNPSAPGQAVTFTVSAAGDVVIPDFGTIPPVGLVTFSADGTPIEGCSYLFLNLMNDQDGNPIIGDYPATCTTAALEEGSHEITATYYDYMGTYNEPSLVLTQVVNATASADLIIDKTDSKDPIKLGSKLVYTLTVSNLGPNIAESVTVTDKLDVNTTYVSVSTPTGWTCRYAKNSGTVTCATDSLASGSSAIIKITVVVNKAAKPGKELVNNAFVSSTTFDPNLSNNAVVQKTMVVK